MRIVRFEYNSETFFGVLDGKNINIINGDPFTNIELTGKTLPLSSVKLLSPVMPSKIVAIGKNYHAHALEMNEGEPTEPLVFLKPSTCVIANNESIIYPNLSKRVDYEGELCVVIGKKCKGVSAQDALSYVLGYTCLNDVTARDIQKSDPQWTRGKGFDTFCPIGPWIETELDPSDLAISTTLNGKTVQNSRTSLMTHGVEKLIEYISAVMTLLPGDCIATGTPEGIGQMQRGDTVSVTIEGIGTLTNIVE